MVIPVGFSSRDPENTIAAFYDEGDSQIQTTRIVSKFVSKFDL